MRTDLLKPHTPSLRAALIRIAAGIVLLAVAIVVYTRYTEAAEHAPQPILRQVPPTCTDSGYTLSQDPETGETTVTDTVPATGHSFGPWESTRSAEGVTCALYRRVCSLCAAEEQTAEYTDLGIPRLSLYGSLEGIGKKSEVPLTARYEDPASGTAFECFATLKHQGHSTLSFPKKNYTLKFFRDENRTDKYKMTFSHWNKENKYILKANYCDPSQCRNLVCANIWADLCAARAHPAPQLAELSNYGAVDGFPVALYLDDEFSGLYTMNLHKDDDLFGMKDGEQQAIMICNSTTLPEAFFREEAQFTDDSPWEVEYCGTEDSQWAKDSMNELIRFVMTADDARFKAELSRYLDTEAAIDYLLAIYALGLPGNGAKDLVLASYGDRWIPSMYDMENAFGLNKDGTAAAAPTEHLPKKTADGWDSATGNLLWDRLLNNFEADIRLRYESLRSSILNPDSLCDRVSRSIAEIPDLLYAADAALYPDMPHPFPQEGQITDYIRGRIAALDSIFS